MTRSGDPVGIDDLSVYVPKLFVSATGEFASSRGIDPAKLTRGIGIERMAVPDRHEDAATMAAMSILDIMGKNDIGPKDVGRIYVGTESAVDEAKAMGTYVIGMLEKVYGHGSFEECSTVEFKSACIGTTHALENVANWAALEDGDQVGLVVASDVARYELGSPGEYTQGAGSVSLLVRKSPRLLALDGTVGVYTRDENDFYRPIGMKTAVVNGKHSNYCYLSAMEGAFASYARRARARGIVTPGEGECLTDYLTHLIFHIPYPKMVEYAATAVFRQEWRDLSRWRNVEAEIGPEPARSDFDDEAEFVAADWKYGRSFSRTGMFSEAYEAKVKPTTRTSRQVGNIYTGSMYLGLASLMEGGDLHSRDRLCFGSYGSGCSAMVFTGLVQEEIGSLSSPGVERRLKDRVDLSLEDYEMLHEGTRAKSVIAPSGEFALLEVDGTGYRHYGYVG